MEQISEKKTKKSITEFFFIFSLAFLLSYLIFFAIILIGFFGLNWLYTLSDKDMLFIFFLLPVTILTIYVGSAILSS